MTNELDETGKHPRELRLFSFGSGGYFQNNDLVLIKTYVIDYIIENGFSPSGSLKIKNLSSQIINEKDPKKKKELKSKLAFFIAAGVCLGTLSDANMHLSSGMICIDIDIDDNPQWFSSEEKYFELIELLKQNKYVFRLWRSPSGGLKLLVFIPDSFQTFRSSFNALEKYFKEIFNLKIDPKCKNPSRKVSLCYSPFLYKNNDSEVFTLMIDKEEDSIDSIVVPIEEDSETFDQVVYCVEQIEKLQSDITKDYADWLKIAFALSSLGEKGREFFHRISRFYSKYNRKECDDQYNHALKRNNGKVKLGTFFYICKENNIKILKKNIMNSNKKSQKKYGNTSIFPEYIYMYLPDTLKILCSHFRTNREKDMFLVCALTILSGCMPNIVGIYHQKLVYPNLFAGIAAPAASGKGVAAWAIKLLNKIQEKFQSIYLKELKEYNEAKKNDSEDLKLPRLKMIKIPGNISSSGIIQVLSNSKLAIIAETEVDTFIAAQSNKEWGNYTYILRCTYENEIISLYRKTDMEHYQISDAHLSVLLCGTPARMAQLYISPENGTFSRFIHYVFDEHQEFKDPFAQKDPLDDKFEKYSEEVSDMFFHYSNLERNIYFELTDKQMNEFYELYKETVDNSIEYYGPDTNGILKRAAVIHFKLCMILTVLRNKQIESSKYVCSDYDFIIATTLISVFKEHSFAMLATLPEKTENPVEGSRNSFFEALPSGFTTKEAIEAGKV